MSILELSEQEQIRRNSLAQLRELGINPYPAAEYPVTATAAQIAAEYSPEKQNFQEVSLAGRIMSRRIMGSVSFFELQDHTGRIQVYIKRDDICPDDPEHTLYNKVFKYADPEAYAANEAAHTAITTAISELSDKLDSVATVISGYSEAVKAEYGYRAENIEEAIGNLSAEVEEAYTARTIAEQQEELTARAEALSALVDQLAAEAAAAEEAATRVEGDLNGDGTVDASDFELLWPYVESDENPAEYDLNGDGVVDIVDVTILSNIYGAAE